MDGARNEQTITLAGGCFWCVEAAFRELDGVLDAVSGYAQGELPNPSYAEVCSGNSGHAEAVQLRFDPRVLPLARLLDVFFAIHDPTTRDRQGADIGPQYRSGIYCHDDAQGAQVRAYVAELGPEVVTEVEPLRGFWPAETQHQDYYAHHPDAGYCRVVIAPKLAHLRQAFAAQRRTR